MKTVQDYRDLGLVFVKGDKICGVTGDLSSNELDIFDGKLCGKKSSKGAAKIGVDCYARARWTPSSFAWRNNDGVKPEYKGPIEVEWSNGSNSKQKPPYSSYWAIPSAECSIEVVKWRPVVLQSDDANKKIQEKFLSALRKDSQASKNTELREEFNLIKELLENKPPFWNKSIKTINCPCVAVNIETNTPTVSPKEDRPMKPVYTAEMHAKNELPPIGAECSLKSGLLNQWFNGVCVGYDEEFALFKMCDGHPFGGMYVGFCLDRIKPTTKTIKVNGFDVTAPMSEAPEDGVEYFIPSLRNYEFFDCHHWRGDSYDELWLSRCQCHQTKSAAIAHAKAMLGIDPNA